MMVHSFDIFDTVLTRSVLHPLSVFDLVQRRLDRHPAVPKRVSRVFSSARIWSEFWARRNNPAEDVNLSQIYGCLDRELSTGPHLRDLLLQAELTAELDCSCPIGENVSRILELQSVGYSLIFISDMYLPSWFLQELLKQHGVDVDREAVYVSGEMGVTKSTGRLYARVLDEFGIDAGRLVHRGDHYYSDFLMPARLGISTDHYSGSGSIVQRQGVIGRKLFLGEYLLRVVSARLNLLLTGGY